MAGPTSPIAPWAVRSSRASKTTTSNANKAAAIASDDTHIKHCVPASVPDGWSLEVVGAGRIAPRCRHSVDVPRPPPLSLAALASSSSASRDELMQLLPLRQLSPGAAGPGLPDTALQGAPRAPGSSPRLHRSGSLRAPRPPGPQPGVRVGTRSPPPSCVMHTPQPPQDGPRTSSVSPFVEPACAWEASSGGDGGGGGSGGGGMGAVAGCDGGLVAHGDVIGTSLTDVFAAREAARRRRSSNGCGNCSGRSHGSAAPANKRGGAASDDGSKVQGGSLQAAASSGSSYCASPYGGWGPSTAPSSGNPSTPLSQYAPYATITVTRTASVSCSGELGHGGRGVTLGAAVQPCDTPFAAARSDGPWRNCQCGEGGDAEHDGGPRGHSCPLLTLQGSEELAEQQQQLARPRSGLLVMCPCTPKGGRAAALSTSLSATISGARVSPARPLLGEERTVAQAPAVQAKALLPTAAAQQPAVGRTAFRRSSATGAVVEDNRAEGRRLQGAGASPQVAARSAATNAAATAVGRGKQSVRDSAASLSGCGVPCSTCRGKGEPGAEAGLATSAVVGVRLLPEITVPQAQPQLRPWPSADAGQVPLQHFPSSSASSRRSSATGGSGSVGSSRRSSRASGCGDGGGVSGRGVGGVGGGGAGGGGCGGGGGAVSAIVQPETPLRLPPVGVVAGACAGAVQADRGGQGRLSSMGRGEGATSSSTQNQGGARAVGILGAVTSTVTPTACLGRRASADTGCLGLVGMSVGAGVGAGAGSGAGVGLGAGCDGRVTGVLQQRLLLRNGSGGAGPAMGCGVGGGAIGSGGSEWRAQRVTDPFVAAAMAAGAGVEAGAGAACGRSCCGPG